MEYDFWWNYNTFWNCEVFDLTHTFPYFVIY